MDSFGAFKKKIADTIRVTVYGFCPVENIKAIYKSEGLYTHHSLVGDYTIMIKDGNRTVYITDFAGTHCPMWLPRNSTIVIEDNMMIYCRENHVTSSLCGYAPPKGLTPRNDYDAFFLAIEDAVKLRCTDRPIITMSSGHDSGAIVAAATKLNLEFDVLSVSAKEKRKILANRAKYVLDRSEAKVDIISLWAPTQNGHEVVTNNIQEGRVVLSGLGADEALVTKDWQLCAEFLKDANETYETKNLQVRYPLLDFKVYEEWNRLTHELKGWLPEKWPLREYLKSLNFPYSMGSKIPFDVT
jgi:hypothetical protein